MSIRWNFCRSVPPDDETFGAKWLKLCNKISRAAALCADKTYLNNWQETMQNIPFVKFVYGRAPQKWAFEYLCKSGSTSTEHQEGYYARHMSSHFTLNTSYVGVIKRQYFILRWLTKQEILFYDTQATHVLNPDANIDPWVFGTFSSQL